VSLGAKETELFGEGSKKLDGRAREEEKNCVEQIFTLKVIET
jgi:hypothetical protein